MKVKNQYVKILEYLHWVSINDHPYSINSGYLLFFETKIMGNTADLTMVQKTIIDTLHKGSLLKEVAVQGVLYQSILNAKLTGRKKLGRKMCTSNGDNRKLENTVKESRFIHLGELHKEWTEAGVHQESPRSDIFRKRATKPLLKQKHRQKHLTWAKEKNNWTVAQWPKVLFSDESTFCFSFGNQGPRIWRKSGEARNPCCLESSVKFPQSEMIWAAVTSADVGPLCFIKSKVNAAVYQEVLEHFMLPSVDKLYGDADFIFQQDFSTCPQCQNHFQVLCWPWYYRAWLASQHAWPEPHLESMGYFQEKDEKQWIQQSRRAEGSIVPHQCHRLIASMPHLTDAGVCAKGARPSIECINEHTLKNFSVLQILFLIDLRKYSNILRDWFFTFISCKL